MNLKKSKSRGFTLIELLIVIAIIAILAVIVVLAINPASILAKSRDSQRMSDMTTLATATNLFLADNQVMPNSVGVSPVATQPGCNASADAKNTCKKNDGSGWVPFEFTLVTSGAPISSLPLDPTNDATYFYRFGWNSTTKIYEYDCALEVDANGSYMTSDGGGNPAKYEVGTSLTILP